MKPLTIICSILLIIGCFHLPVGYYTFLRIAICIGAIAVTVYNVKRNNSFYWLWIGVAILFNPIIPIYLHAKAVWVVFDIACAILFGVKCFMLKEKEQAPHK